MRLIDADALHIKIELTPYYVCESGRKKQYGTKMNKTVRFGPGETLLLYEDVSTLILEAPIIGADLVRHGRWLDESKTIAGILLPKTVCSVCGWFTYSAAGELFVSDHKYCPHCCAKMNGGDPND